MSRRIRRLLFYGLLILFLVTGIGAVIYSSGWRLNLRDCSLLEWRNCTILLQKTGAIFIKTEPRQVTIKLDGKLHKDESGLILGGTLIQDLKPKTYLVEIEKDGFLAWQKNLVVEPEMVVEAQNIILVPEEVKKDLISIPRLRGDQLESLNNDDSKLIFKDQKSGIYYLYDFNNPSVVFNINLNFQNAAGNIAVKKIAFHPFDFNKLIIEAQNGLYILDTLRLKAERITQNRPTAWTAMGSTLYYAEPVDTTLKNSEPAIFLFNLIVKTKNSFNLPEDLLKDAPRINQLGVSDSESWLAFIDGSDDLYLLYLRDKTLQKLGHNVSIFDFSPDNKKIAFLDKDRKLNIFFLEDWDKNNYKEAGEFVQFKLQNQPTGLKWHTASYHLFLSYPDSFVFMEIDDRKPTNSYPLLGEIGNNFYYSAASNLIYFGESGSLYKASI